MDWDAEGGNLLEKVDPVLVLLQEVVHQGEQVLDGLILGDVSYNRVQPPTIKLFLLKGLQQEIFKVV